MKLGDLRKEYTLHGLTQEHIADTPHIQFDRWFTEAQNAKIEEPNAMVLATVTPEGMPTSRVVLLKHFDEKGFIFFTNYESKKGKNLAANPQASLLFFWLELQRQVRIEGVVEKRSRQESADYFFSRPLESQIGAWASAQSSIIENREQLDTAFSDYQQRFGSNVPLPDFWGGYRLMPHYFEFWQGRPNRLHDRIEFSRDGMAWKKQRLSP
mgnify:FL=1